MYHIIEKITAAQFNAAVEPFRQWLTMDDVCGLRPHVVKLQEVTKTVKFDMLKDGTGSKKRFGYVFLVEPVRNIEVRYIYWVDANDDHTGSTIEFFGCIGKESILRASMETITLAIAAKLLEKADRDHIPQGNLMLLV